MKAEEAGQNMLRNMKAAVEKNKTKLQHAKEYAIDRGPEIATVLVAVIGVGVAYSLRNEIRRNSAITALVGDQVAGLRDDEWYRWNTLQDRRNRDRMTVERAWNNEDPESFTYYPGLGVMNHHADEEN